MTGIRGNLRHKTCHCIGTAHSGAVDKQYRHDAVLAMADLLMKMEKHWAQWLVNGEDLVFTVGVLKTALSSAIAIIPGEVTFSVDMRSLSMDTLDRFHKLLVTEAEAIGAARGVSFDFDRTLVCKAADVDPKLFTHLKASPEKAGINYLEVPSGAGHDAAVMADMGVPITMIFVANQNGSHNWREEMKLDDFMLANEVLFTAIANYDN